jgi:hypothetical protein
MEGGGNYPCGSTGITHHDLWNIEINFSLHYQARRAVCHRLRSESVSIESTTNHAAEHCTGRYLSAVMRHIAHFSSTVTNEAYFAVKGLRLHHQ